MALPHYSQSRASRDLLEPVYTNLFEVTLLTPFNDDAALILEHVKSIGGLSGVNPSVDAVGQKYKFSDRSFAGMPGQTYVDLSIAFTLNLSNTNQLYLYKQMRNWYAIAYNPATAEMGLKKEYTGQMIVQMFNRKGDIFRKLNFEHCFITGGLDTMDSLDYESSEPQEMTVTFRCDTWTEELV